MRYRFSAKNSNGENRTGYLDATDDDNAKAQLSRRGLELTSLEIAENHQFPETVRLAPESPAFSPVAVSAPREKIELHWGRVIAGLLIVFVLSGLCLTALQRIFSDHTYRMTVLGEMHLLSKGKQHHPDFSKARVHLWLPEMGWLVFPKGSVYRKTEQGKWEKVSRTAKFHWQIQPEGDYRLEVDLAMPRPPTQYAVYFHAPGYSTRSKTSSFRIKKDQFVSQLTSVVLVPKRKLKPKGAKRVTTRS